MRKKITEHLENGIYKYVFSPKDIYSGNYTNLVDRIRMGKIKFDGFIDKKLHKISEKELKKVGIETKVNPENPNIFHRKFDENTNYSFHRAGKGWFMDHITHEINLMAQEYSPSLESKKEKLPSYRKPLRYTYNNDTNFEEAFNKILIQSFNDKSKFAGKTSKDFVRLTNQDRNIRHSETSSIEIAFYKTLSTLHYVLNYGHTLLKYDNVDDFMKNENFKEFNNIPLYYLFGKENFLFKILSDVQNEDTLKKDLDSLMINLEGDVFCMNEGFISDTSIIKIKDCKDSRSLISAYRSLNESDKLQIMKFVSYLSLGNNNFYIDDYITTYCSNMQSFVNKTRTFYTSDLSKFHQDYQKEYINDVSVDKNTFVMSYTAVPTTLSVNNSVSISGSASIRRYIYTLSNFYRILVDEFIVSNALISTSILSSDYKVDDNPFQFCIGYPSKKFKNLFKNSRFSKLEDTDSFFFTDEGVDFLKDLNNLFIDFNNNSFYYLDSITLAYYVNRPQLVEENIGLKPTTFSSIGSPIVNNSNFKCKKYESDITQSNTYYQNNVRNLILKQYVHLSPLSPDNSHRLMALVDKFDRKNFMLSELPKAYEDIITIISKSDYVTDYIIQSFMNKDSFLSEDFAYLTQPKVYNWNDNESANELRGFSEKYSNYSYSNFLRGVDHKDYDSSEDVYGMLKLTYENKLYITSLIGGISSHFLTKKQVQYLYDFFNKSKQSYINLCVADENNRKYTSNIRFNYRNYEGSSKLLETVSRGNAKDVREDLEKKNIKNFDDTILRRVKLRQLGDNYRNVSYEKTNIKLHTLLFDFVFDDSKLTNQDFLDFYLYFNNDSSVRTPNLSELRKALDINTPINNLNSRAKALNYIVDCDYTLLQSINAQFGYIDEDLYRTGYYSLLNSDPGYLDENYEVTSAREYEWLENHSEYRWNDSQECYQTYDDWCDSNDGGDYDDEDVVADGYCKRYHYYNPRPDHCKSTTITTFGLEVEKEDENALYKEYASDIYNRCQLMKETDSSLNHLGYEIITPTFDLHKFNFESWVKDNDLEYLYNANRSKNCGMHLHIGRRGLSGMDYFDRIKYYTPLLYAMYETRTDNNYSVAKSMDKLRQERERTQALNIMNNRIEIRLFPSPKGLKTLLWRLDLLKIMDSNPVLSVNDLIRNIVDGRTRLHKHLRKVYSMERLTQRLARVTYYINKFEDENWKIESIVPRTKLRKIKYPDLSNQEVQDAISKNISKNKRYGSLGYDEELTPDNQEQISF